MLFNTFWFLRTRKISNIISLNFSIYLFFPKIIVKKKKHLYSCLYETGVSVDLTDSSVPTELLEVCQREGSDTD